RVLRRFAPGALSCAFSPDGKTLAAGYMLGALKLFDWTGSTVTARKPGAELKTASGQTVARLRPRAQYRADYTDHNAYGVRVTDGKTAGYISPNAVYDEDFMPPLILPAKIRQTESGAVEVLFAALDDVALGQVKVDGRAAVPADEPYDCGNLRSCRLFAAGLPKTSSVCVTAGDIAGKSTATVFFQGMTIPDAGPYFLRAKAGADIEVYARRDGKTPLALIKKGESFDTAGYKKGWYYLRDGTWLYDAAVIAR
ncbi:MAG: hypothetical protein PHW69_09650, partial [Elusimicrobiaceae bacterium]|nr:hypothetical protein [Elusimicrobiaceae bacterium]